MWYDVWIDKCRGEECFLSWVVVGELILASYVPKEGDHGSSLPLCVRVLHINIC